MFKRTAVLLACFLTQAFIAHEAAAFTFCVSDAGGLRDAFAAASTGGAHDGEDNIVDLVAGTYSAATIGAGFDYEQASTQALQLQGGFAPGCATRSADPSATVVDGASAYLPLRLFNLYGPINVDGVTIQHGLSTEYGGGLAINYCGLCIPQSTNSISLTHLIMRDNTSTHRCGGFFAIAGGSMLVANSLFIRNAAGDTLGGAACLYSVDEILLFHGNTVADNTSVAGTDATGGVYFEHTVEIEDSIFWSNSGFGLLLGSQSSVMLRNDYGSRTGEDPILEVGDVSVNPRFYDPVDGDYRLASDSPLLGFSDVLLTGSDLDGHPFPAGGFQDIGAYEDTVFVEGFDPP
jgi:hypothetical protein